METHLKPRVSPAQYEEMMKREPTYADGTVADWIEKFIRERTQPGGRMIGPSQQYTLRLVQRSKIGAVHHTALRAADFLAHCKARRATGVLPQTIAQDMMYLSGVLKYALEIWEIPSAEQAYGAYRKAVPQLKKEQLIAKSQPRDRRPTPDELVRLLALFELPPKKAVEGFIPMVPVVKFSYLSGRRISETCRMERRHINVEDRTCIIENLKNSKGKGFHGEFPLLGEAWAIVAERLGTIPADPKARLFPYRSKSCGAKWAIACTKLGIPKLRLHDLRRHCFSTMFEDGYSVPEVQVVSQHRNPTILLKTYTALRPKDLHMGPASKRERAAA